MIRSYYHVNAAEMSQYFSVTVFHLKLGHRFNALLKVCSDRDDTAPLR